MRLIFCLALSIRIPDEYLYNAETESQNMPSRTLATSVGSTNEVKHNDNRGMVLPYEPHSITFDEIRYAVDMPQVFI